MTLASVSFQMIAPPELLEALSSASNKILSAKVVVFIQMDEHKNIAELSTLNYLYSSRFEQWER